MFKPKTRGRSHADRQKTTPEDQEADYPVPEAFKVHDRQSANWVVRKIAEARVYAQQAEAWAEAEKRRARREEGFFVRRFGVDLQRWLVGELAKQGGKTKSISLPAGRIGLRRAGAKVEVVDQQAAMAWAKAHLPEAIKHAESLLKTPLRDYLETTGELPDGTTLQPERDEFYIR